MQARINLYAFHCIDSSGALECAGHTIGIWLCVGQRLIEPTDRVSHTRHNFIEGTLIVACTTKSPIVARALKELRFPKTNFVEGEWWTIHDKRGRCLGRVDGDEFIVGPTRILYSSKDLAIYSTEVPAAYVADIEGDRAISPQGDVLFRFVRSSRFRA